jgi:RNA polymerase sigma-70 factor (ECF subfamily)
MDNPSDYELVNKVQSGDKEAFGTLYTRHRDRVYGYVRKIVGDPEITSDLVGDTFLRALESLHQVELTSTFGTWVIGIAKHAIADHFRSQKRWEKKSAVLFEIFVGSGSTDPHQEIEKDFDINDELNHILTELSSSHRAALTLRELEQLSLAEIAEKLYGENTPTTRHRASALIHRARKAAEKIGQMTREIRPT